MLSHVLQFWGGGTLIALQNNSSNIQTQTATEQTQLENDVTETAGELLLVSEDGTSNNGGTSKGCYLTVSQWSTYNIYGAENDLNDLIEGLRTNAANDANANAIWQEIQNSAIYGNVTIYDVTLVMQGSVTYTTTIQVVGGAPVSANGRVLTIAGTTFTASESSSGYIFAWQGIPSDGKITSDCTINYEEVSGLFTNNACTTYVTLSNGNEATWKNIVALYPSAFADNGATIQCDSGGNSYFTALSGALIIPSSVTSIGNSAFKSCSGLTSVTIPNSVTSIGSSAFLVCTGLTSLTISSSVTSIANYVFYYCYSLTSITIPDSVTSIGDEAFRDCNRLTSITIPDSVTSIGYKAFTCKGLTSVTIGSGVTSIGGNAFDSSPQLTKVNYTGDIASWCGITFSDGFSNPLVYGIPLYINDVEVTNLVIPNSVTSIGYCAFYCCSSLTSITIPSSVTSIEKFAFCDCTNLETINFSGTVAQWNAITLGSSWNNNVPATSVTCTDGTVTL